MNQSLEQNERQIRVFISSTFRDMKAERDYLVKFTFPQLRRLCESRGVTWGEVDLRWGVTDEEAAEGKVLPICLEEIRRCRPWFIGLLGERYGWVPQHIPDDLLAQQPWLEQHRHRSVTELEIIHGVLRNADMHQHACFYFRDPNVVADVPAEKKADFTSESPELAEKLQQLKNDIRHARDEQICQLRESFKTPEELGAWVLEDFAKIINDRWPEGSQPSELERERLDHEAYAHIRAQVYIGREEYFQQLDDYTATGAFLRPRKRERVVEDRVRADGEKQTPVDAVVEGIKPLVILGESGSGKSALLANWVARYRQAHPDALVLQHYIGATPYSADWAAMLRRLMGELKRRLGLQQDIPDQPDDLRSAFPNWLYMANASLSHPMGEGGRRPGEGFNKIIIVLDALNQLEDRDGALDLVWLPPVLPDNVRLIVSTLPGCPLDETRRRQWPEMCVQLLNVDERKKLIEKYLGDRSKKLSDVRRLRIAAAPQSANPLYLRVLLDELCVTAEHEKLDEKIDHYLSAPSPAELYEKVIARWEDDYEGDTDLVGDSLSLLWASRRGLSEVELLEALGDANGPLPRACWSPLFHAMAEALVSPSGLLNFAHDFLRTAARETYLPDEEHQQKAHRRLADYFEPQPASPRRRDELPWQLAEAKAWPRLCDLLADRVFFTSAWEANQFEVKTYWARIEAGSTLRMVAAYRAQIEQPDLEPGKNHLWQLSKLLGDTGHPGEAFRVCMALVGHSRQTSDLNSLQSALGNQAVILQARGDLGGAMTLHKEEEQICRKLSNLDGLSRTLGNQAVILHKRGDLEGAMTLHKEEERICRQLGDLDGLSRVLGHQALILQARGDLDGAMTLEKEKERICRQLGNLEGLSRTLGNQAVILHKGGDLEGAMMRDKDVERICRQLGNQGDLQGTLGNQALILQARGDLNGAMALLKEQERICRQLGNVDSLSNSLNGQALILRDRGDLEGAMTLLKEMERICRQFGNVESFAISLGNQSSILMQMGRARGALPLAEEALRLANSHGYAALAKQITLILNALRQAIQSADMAGSAATSLSPKKSRWKFW
jgi:tetratricopeptide (TPR) repeat protein